MIVSAILALTIYILLKLLAPKAVVYPAAMEKVMDETQLRKARMLGGKLGKKVASLLPENETTMGSIARLLPLNRLEEAIGEESGRWVFDACRGIDHEVVRATLKVLPKSITVSLLFLLLDCNHTVLSASELTQPNNTILCTRHSSHFPRCHILNSKSGQ